MRRDDALVLVDACPVDRAGIDPRWAVRYVEALGRPPRGRALLTVGRSRASEWLAAEVVLTAEERWGECVGLDIHDSTESQSFACELLEVLAVKWPLLVAGLEERLMTIDDVRSRFHSGATEIFSPGAGAALFTVVRGSEGPRVGVLV